MMVTWYVYSEGIGDLTVSKKYSLLSLRVQLGSLLFWNMYKYKTTKYFEMAYLCLLFREHLFRGLEPKCTMG
jgi:hypothetical protein